MTEIEKLEAQVAEWMGVANQQILRIQELEKERDSALAIARQAVEVLEPLKAEVGGALSVWDEGIRAAIGNTNTACLWKRYEAARAFLARPDVKAMGGGRYA